MQKVTLANAKTFECLPEQSILEAARAQSITLEYSCRTGRCGVCKTRVLAGITSPLKVEESLSPDEQASGHILTCCRTAVTDIELEAEDLGALGSIETKTLPCRIDNLHLLSDDVLEVTLRTPPASRLVYLPGQYIDVIGNGGIRRSYSVANAPREDGKLTLQIRKVPGGAMSRYWFNDAKVNDLLRLEGPLGTFCLRPSKSSQLLLLATGTGIAPIRAILEQLAEAPLQSSYSQITVYWGGRTTKDIYWTPEYPALPLRFVPVLSRSPDSPATKRYVQDAAVADGIPWNDAVVYACGSEAMIGSARAKLIAEGLNPKSFYSDAFVSSS